MNPCAALPLPDGADSIRSAMQGQLLHNILCTSSFTKRSWISPHSEHLKSLNLRKTKNSLCFWQFCWLIQFIFLEK